MSRKKLEERNVRKLQKTSRGSVQVTLPIELIRELRWKDGQKVVVRKSGEKIVIEDWKE